MSKKNKKAKKSYDKIDTGQVSVPDKITVEKMQHIIAHAIVEAEDIKKDRENKQKEIAAKDWSDSIGYKDYSSFKWYKRFPLQLINSIVVLFHVATIPKQKVKGTAESFAFIAVFIYVFFWILKWIFLIASGVFLVFIFMQLFSISSGDFSAYKFTLSIMLLILSFMFSIIFRILSFEVNNIEDYNFLFGLFASIVSIVSIIIAFAALLRS